MNQIEEEDENEDEDDAAVGLRHTRGPWAVRRQVLTTFLWFLLVRLTGLGPLELLVQAQ
jgi:hypothetical protein